MFEEGDTQSCRCDGKRKKSRENEDGVGKAKDYRKNEQQSCEKYDLDGPEKGLPHSREF